MKTFCGTFGYFLFHPENTSLICKNRALKLRLPQCCSCLGLEVPESPEEEASSVIPLPAPKSIPGPDSSSDSALLDWIKEQGMAQIGRMLGDTGVDRSTVHRWVRKGRIPNKYKDLLNDLRNVA